MGFSDGFAQFGNSSGVNIGNVTTRPTFIINDSLTWTKGEHTLKGGMEYRKIMGNIHSNGGQAGNFTFGRGSTGLLGVNSGSPIASFLLGAVDSANATFRAVDSAYPRQNAWIFFGGDTWNVNEKLTFDYGLRWDYYSPSSEKYDRFSFFDPIGANPGAGGRPGRLAFAGDSYGAASYGARYPEEDFYGGFAPRFGAVYRVNEKTVLRSGWGIFYMQAFYPGWGGGISQDGFSTTPSFNTTLGGIQPAFFLEQGLPQNFARPPLIQSDYRNGQGLLYRPVDANKRPYSHQWNITVDREVGRNVSLSLAYVGSAGRRLPSSIEPLNAIDPKFLSMGDALNHQFTPGMTSLDGVPLPYAGWVEQMTGCAPSVAQALRPFPQYCDNLQGLNENVGSSMYNSLQMKLEKRFSEGIYALVSYTLSKTMSSASDNTQRDAVTWSGLQGVISPFEKDRNDVIAATDTPHVLSAAFVYELPVGQGKKYLNQGGIANVLAGGWQMSTIFKYSSGLPLYFRSGFCNVPGAFRAACIPGITNAGSVFAQDKGSFDPAQGTALQQGRLRVGVGVQLLLRQGQPGRGIGAGVRLSQPGSVVHQEHTDGRRHEPADPVRGLQPVELAHVHQPRRVGRAGLQQRSGEPGLREMERIGDRAAHDAGRRADSVLACTPLLTRVLLRRALTLALLVPTLAGAAPPSQGSSQAASARQVSQDLPPALATRFSEGVAALSAGQLDAAEAAFRAVIRDGGDRAFVRHNLGIVLQQRGRHADALVEFRAASRLDPSFGPSRLLAGTSLLALGQARAAVAELGVASRLMPREPAVHLQRADACERIKDDLCLTDEYRTLVELSPANPEYAYRLGKAYLRLSQSAHARIQAIDPRAARLSQALGREYLEQGRADLAERAFKDAIARDATLVDVHLALARICLADGRLDEAGRASARALVLAPDSKDARALQAAIEAARTPR